MLPAADSPREVWWTISCNNTVLFSSSDVKTTKFNQHLPMVLTLFNMSNSRFQKLVMFQMWCHHGIILWHHSDGAWHNGLFLTTASNVNCWTNVANHVPWLWQAGDTENFKHQLMGQLWVVSWSRAAQSQDEPASSLGHGKLYPHKGGL